MPWRVGAERRLGRGVHAPLGGVAVLTGRGIEVGAARVGDDHDVAVRLAPRGERPRHLPVVEDVDVVDFLKFLGSTAKVKIKVVGVRSGMRLNADIQNATLGEVLGTIAKTYVLEWKLEGDGSITVSPFRK